MTIPNCQDKPASPTSISAKTRTEYAKHAYTSDENNSLISIGDMNTPTQKTAASFQKEQSMCNFGLTTDTTILPVIPPTPAI